MKTLTTIILFISCWIPQYVFSNCIYTADITETNNICIWNDQTIVKLSRAGFPNLVNGRTYTIEYNVYPNYFEGEGGDDRFYTNTIYATYTCNIGDTEMQEIQGYIDDGTLIDIDESAGFFHIIQDVPFDPEDPSFNDWEPENPGTPNDFQSTFQFHFEFPESVRVNRVIIKIYD